MSVFDFLSPFYYLLMNIVTVICTVFIKRDKQMILFGSWYGERFAGNSRFLFQYLAENKKKYGFKKVIWVTRNKKLYNELQEMHYEVYMMKSLQSIYYHFKAGTHAVNVNTATSRATNAKRYGDILGVLSMGARHLYLNHAAAAVKTNTIREACKRNYKSRFLYIIYIYLCGIYFFRHWLLHPGGWDEYDFLAASEQNKKDQILMIPPKSPITFVKTGFPQLCPCLAYTKTEKQFIKYLQKRSKVILYAPTYRTSNQTGFIHPLTDSTFSSFLQKNRYLWLEKLHPGAKTTMRSSHYDPDYTLELSQQFDLNILMPYIHVLITDYSSVYQKAIYYDIPFIFYIPDLKGYEQHDKSIVPDFFDEISGIKTETPAALIDAITAALEKDYILSIKDDYIKLKNLYFDGRQETLESYAEIVNSFFGEEPHE